MSRSYSTSRVKKHRVYSVEDLMTLLSVTANTVSNWVGEGLRPSDFRRPYRFRGAVVQAFHKQRAAKNKRSLQPGMFNCVTCKQHVVPEISTVEDLILHEKHAFRATCPTCKSVLIKLSSKADGDKISARRNPNTSPDSRHEVNTSSTAGIWISGEIDLSDVHFENDRLLYDWQIYAGRYHTKTVDQHLASLRYCEGILQGKAFAEFTVEDAAAVREDLKRRANPSAPDKLSASTIKHVVSHLCSFFEWLNKRPGHRRMPRDLTDYFTLPKGVLAKSLPTMSRDYATVDEAGEILTKMPKASLHAKRAATMFALAYLGGLRADTITSLRLGHIDIERKTITQDGRAARTKNGKSLVVHWFPIPEVFAEAVVTWIEMMQQLGFRNDDALFPPLERLKAAAEGASLGQTPVAPMSTAQAVSDAFSLASAHGSSRLTPHSAKHTLAAERDRRSLTHEERKAWSENLGHEHERTTEIYYGKMTSARRKELIEGIADTSPLVINKMTTEEKAALFDRFCAEMAAYRSS